MSTNISRTYPLMERPATAALLAFVAGSLDAWAIMNAGAFSTAQTGNVVASAVYLAIGDWGKFFYYWASILAFGLGAFICGWLIGSRLKAGKTYTVRVLLLEAFIIATIGVVWALGIIPPSAQGAYIVCLIISFVAGAQGNSFRYEDGANYGNVAITAVLQGTFNFLAQAPLKKDAGRAIKLKWAGRYGLVLLGFAAGAATGARMGIMAGWEISSVRGTPISGTGWALMVPAAITIILAFLAFRDENRHVDPDPDVGPGMPQRSTSS